MENTVDKKKILIISDDGVITDLAWQIVKEGHEVRYYIDSETDKEVGDGFISKVDDWKENKNWADLIIFDGVIDQGDIAKALREEGKLVVGGTPYTDLLESDRIFGQEELKKVGVSIPFHKEFNFDDAIDYVKAHPDKYFIKPTSKAKDLKDLLFVGEDDDGQDVIQVLKDYKTALGNQIQQIQLQRRISGVEIAVGAFFNGHEFIYPINVNFEHNNWFPGNLGPSTAEMGTAMFWSMPNKIFNLTLKKFEHKLKTEGYVGYVDMKCIVNGNGIYALQWTTRFGYPTISIQKEGMISPIGEFLYNLAKGSNPKLRVKTGFQIGVRITVPPFPFNDSETFNVKSKDSIVYFNKKKIPDGVHIEDIKVVNGEWVVTGNTGTVLIVCGSGQTMQQARTQAYKRIRNINIPHMYYRDDIGEGWFEDSDKLHNWGYLREI